MGIPNGKGILLKNGKEYRGEWQDFIREGSFLIIDQETKFLEGNKKAILLQRYHRGIRQGNEVEIPNKAVIAGFDETFKNYFPKSSKAIFEKKIKKIKKTLIFES